MKFEEGEDDKEGMTMRIWTHVRYNIPHSIDTRLVEWLFAIIILHWGILFLQAPEIFQRPGFEYLAAKFDVRVWAFACLTIGSIRLLVLGINGSMRRMPRFRIFLSICGAYFWIHISLGFYEAQIVSTWITVYPYFILCEFVNIIRASRDGRKEELFYSKRAEAADGHTRKS